MNSTAVFRRKYLTPRDIPASITASQNAPAAPPQYTLVLNARGYPLRYPARYPKPSQYNLSHAPNPPPPDLMRPPLLFHEFLGTQTTPQYNQPDRFHTLPHILLNAPQAFQPAYHPPARRRPHPDR